MTKKIKKNTEKEGCFTAQRGTFIFVPWSARITLKAKVTFQTVFRPNSPGPLTDPLVLYG